MMTGWLNLVDNAQWSLISAGKLEAMVSFSLIHGIFNILIPSSHPRYHLASKSEAESHYRAVCR